jgi:hypothetical protein
MTNPTVKETIRGRRPVTPSRPALSLVRGPARYPTERSVSGHPNQLGTT